MSVDLSGLDYIREGAAPKSQEIAKIEALDPGRTILAVDQSLSNTGWAFLIGKVVILTGNIKTDPQKGHEGTLTRGGDLFAEFCHLLDDRRPDLIVHELPPVGSRMMRPESSLVAAQALRDAAITREVPVRMVGAQKVKKRLTGNGNAKKPEVRQAILSFDPQVREKKPLNEAIFDAIGLGWVMCEQER
jgi:Holliday junction resolvasome RuvABC endonuclease subunit